MRGLRAVAAAEAGCRPLELSFSKVHLLLVAALTGLFLAAMAGPHRASTLLWLLAEAAAAKLPRRQKARQNEPRAQCHKPQGFPTINGSREEARKALEKN